MTRTLALATVLGVSGLVLAVGCSSSTKDESPTPFPQRSSSSGATDGGSSGSSGSSGTSGTSGTSGAPADCTNHAKVDDRPACDQCARAKCCKEILACDQSSSCLALQDCLAACAPNDVFCQLSCSGNDTAVNLLSDVGNCAKRNCPSECPSTASDGGLDLDAF